MDGCCDAAALQKINVQQPPNYLFWKHSTVKQVWNNRTPATTC
jgi:hypothetical protein